MLSCQSKSPKELMAKYENLALDSNGANVLVLTMYNEILCFKSTHIMHAAIAIVLAIILIALTFLVVFLLFESRKVNSNIFAK